jgi:hypothetical protein
MGLDMRSLKIDKFSLETDKCSLGILSRVGQGLGVATKPLTAAKHRVKSEAELEKNRAYAAVQGVKRKAERRALKAAKLAAKLAAANAAKLAAANAGVIAVVPMKWRCFSLLASTCCAP